MGVGFRHVDRTKGAYSDGILLPQVVDKIIICVMTSNAATGRRMPNKCNKRTDLYTMSSQLSQFCYC